MDGRRALRRGISFGNALDVARDEKPPLQLEERYFAEVSAAGFDFVRLPVRWSAHASDVAPYLIDEPFFERVDRAVECARNYELAVVLNVHHYHELQRTPDAHAERLLALWEQIARRYADRSDWLLFELLNEPRDALTAAIWNDLLAGVLATVRTSNPDRIVIVGPASMNDLGALPELLLPEDHRLVATIHYYAPFKFTHQGAPWVAGAERWLGTRWGSDADQAAITQDLSDAANWACDRGLPLLIGEFGAYEQADLESRRLWTSFVRSEAERLNSSWCYWDFGTDFGAFDPQQNTWCKPLRDALLL